MKLVSASFLGTKDELATIDEFNKSSVDFIHFDVMDGTLVEKVHLLPEEIAPYLNACQKKIDIHLMVDAPSSYLEVLKDYAISYVTLHLEIPNFKDQLKLFKGRGFNVGISIKPDTALENVFPFLEEVSLVLVMSVNPGASGQQFFKGTKERLAKLKQEIQKRALPVKISVDGGICQTVLEDVDDADILVSSSYILQDLSNNVAILKNNIEII